MEILILLLLLSLLNNKPSNYLMCGLFAWTGDSVKKFNWDKFNMLGVLNDSRGGDSCGRVVGDVSSYGLDKLKNYSNLIQRFDNEVVREPVVIGHTRKASFGYAVNEENAQPVVIQEDGEVVFVLAHNGTLHNIDDLREKYPIELPKKSTDSYILANIIYKYGFNVLGEYYGTAALVMYDRRRFLEDKDTVVHLFRGESKEYSTSTNQSEERPLHVYLKKNNSIYISSEPDPLYAIGGNYDSIKEVVANTVITLKNGKLEEEVIPIKRATKGQHRYFPSTKKSSGNMVDSHHDSGYSFGSEASSGIDNGLGDSCGLHKHWQGLQLDDESLANTPGNDVIFFRQGKYWKNSSILNGVVHVNVAGYCFDNPREGITKPLYFLGGFLIKDHEAYQAASRKYKELSKVQKTGMEGFSVLGPYVDGPIWSKPMTWANGYIRYWDNKQDRLAFYTGLFKPMFCDRHYRVDNGDIKARYNIEDDEIVRPEGFYSLATNDSIEEPFNNSDMIKSEIAHELSTLLETMEKVKNNIRILGEDLIEVKPVLNNIDVLQDLLLSGDDEFLTKNLNIVKEWEAC